MNALGSAIMALSESAARHSEPGPGVTRVLGSEEHRALLVDLKRWMHEAGLRVELDAAGNLVGRTATTEGAPTLIIGSHQDTVRQGGKYDGMLGILLPLVVLQYLHQNGDRLAVNIELVAFSDEEGARFSSTLVGSSALAGTFDPAILSATDAAGTTMAQALRDLGAEPDRIPELARNPASICGFLEVHIEQGPVLESLGLPVGVVTAITGIERHSLSITGKAGHAGTTPMALRKDALVAATAVVQAVDQHCRNTEDLVGVVGELVVTPNAVNVIPSRVDLTIELRSPKSAIRLAARERLFADIAQRLANSGCTLEHRLTYQQTEVRCAERLQQQLSQAIEGAGYSSYRLFSGAGHDGLAMAQLTDVGMLFVRCKDGLSHHPDESITTEDAEAAAQVLKHFLLNLEA